MEWEWFDRLADSPNVEQALCASGDGRVLRASRSLTDDIERAAAMLQSVDMLLQALASVLGCGRPGLVQISTSNGYIAIVPLPDHACYLVVQTARAAPLLLFMIELGSALSQAQAGGFIPEMELETHDDDTPVLDAAELIAAVREWLRGRSALR